MVNESLPGTVGSELSKLTSLTTLIIESCGIGGRLQDVEWSRLSNLNELSLDSNEIGGSCVCFQLCTAVGQLTCLVAAQQQIAAVPSSLVSLPRLQVLAISQNNFDTHTLPRLNVSASLVYLSVWGNNIEGTIPAEIYDYRRLVQLRMQYCSFSGTISPRISLLTNLRLVALMHNKLSARSILCASRPLFV